MLALWRIEDNFFLNSDGVFIPEEDKCVRSFVSQENIDTIDLDSTFRDTELIRRANLLMYAV